MQQLLEFIFLNIFPTNSLKGGPEMRKDRKSALVLRLRLSSADRRSLVRVATAPGLLAKQLLKPKKTLFCRHLTRYGCHLQSLVNPDGAGRVSHGLTQSLSGGSGVLTSSYLPTPPTSASSPAQI